MIMIIIILFKYSLYVILKNLKNKKLYILMTVILYDVYHFFCLNHNLKYNQYDLLYMYCQGYIGQI
jgi:hypothetical protein